MAPVALTSDWLFLLIQWVGVICGVVQVLLAKANRVLLYPFGIASILITLYVLYDAGLYAEILLNLYYLAMSIYGWAHWAKRRGEAPVKAGYSGKREWIITLLIVAIGFPLLYYALVHFTDSTVPAWDAWVSATAWAGMWLLAQRKIENWVWLNISNAIAIPLLIHKGLHLYAALTLFLFIVAIFGFIEWRRIIRREGASL
ncbi:nicotinamide riboside transporter PnuC [Parapedobacter sp. GCM10030251]|uniref:nicotinamide riboside transporter PnuC n=1 Tax=Parapedobacter sp. GCM10030251 TaxID=3273419 RepID=UPI00361D1D4E